MPGTHSGTVPLKDPLWLVKQRPHLSHRGYPPPNNATMMLGQPKLKAQWALPKHQPLERDRRKDSRKELPRPSTSDPDQSPAPVSGPFPNGSHSGTLGSLTVCGATGIKTFEGEKNFLGAAK